MFYEVLTTPLNVMLYVYVILNVVLYMNALNIMVICNGTFPKEKACTIFMFCYLIYIKKYENTFCNIVRAKLKI